MSNHNPKSEYEALMVTPGDLEREAERQVMPVHRLDAKSTIEGVTLFVCPKCGCKRFKRPRVGVEKPLCKKCETPFEFSTSIKKSV